MLSGAYVPSIHLTFLEHVCAYVLVSDLQSHAASGRDYATYNEAGIISHCRSCQCPLRKSCSKYS